MSGDRFASGPPFPEADLLPLSGLQHLIFCERQFALIHVEQAWRENVFTIEGRQMHERVDEPGGETRGDERTVRALPMRSLRLGLSGRADTVELTADPVGVSVPGRRGTWRLFPVEHKRGRPKAHRADEVQLCAQGMCLEEMLGAAVPAGALFYGQTRRRQDVAFDQELRALVERTAARAQELMSRGLTPPGVFEKKCEKCSLLEICQPKALKRSAQRFVAREIETALADLPCGATP